MSDIFISKVNGKEIFAKRAERTRSGVNLETIIEGTTTTYGILPAGIATPTKDNDENNTLATQKYVLDQMGSVAEALVFKGTIGDDADTPTVTELPATHKVGWTYKVATAGTYAGRVCELGDMIICVNNGTVKADGDWTVVQNNIDGAVSGPATVTADANIALFAGTSGRTIKDSGVTINKSTDTGALDGSSDAKVPTSKAVKDAITGAVNALDATVNSTGGTNVAAQVVETDGTITAVTITTDNTINKTDLSNAINALDVSDLVGDSEGSMAGKTLKTLSETDGKIAATFQDIKITSDKVTDRQTSTFDGTADTLTTGTAVKAAIDALDVSNISGFGAGKTLATLTETDGKIAATFQSIQITESQVTNLTTNLAAKADKVTGATNGNFAGLDGNGNLTDSGSKAADFATAAQGTKADSAIQGVMLNNVELTKDADNKVNIPYYPADQGSPSNPGLMTYETVEL